jgi:hypothetical protein
MSENRHKETSRNVCLGRVYQAAQEILQYLPVPGWEHSAEASGAYERLLSAVRQMKRNVATRKKNRERKAAPPPEASGTIYRDNGEGMRREGTDE